MELRSGRAQWIRTCAEFIRGQGWCSVAYFQLDGQSTRLICNKLASFSRSPLPAPFDVDDEVVVAGSVNKEKDRFDALCASFVRQPKIIDQNPTVQALFGSMLFFMSSYRTARILWQQTAGRVQNLGSAISHNSGLVMIVFFMLVSSLLSLLLLLIGTRLVIARRMVTSATPSVG